MTQMLLFDFATTAASPVPVTTRSTHPRSSQPSETSVAQTAAGSSGRRATSAAGVAGGSLPLYDPAEGELHRIGDLAQLVLARYEIVHRRRAARRKREAANRLAG